MELEGSFETSLSTPNQNPANCRTSNTHLPMRLLNCTAHITIFMSKFGSSLGQRYQAQTISYLVCILLGISSMKYTSYLTSSP